MRTWWLWLVFTFVLTAAIHIFLVWKTPAIVNYRWLRRLQAEGMRSNELYHAKRPKIAGRDIVPYDNPDNVSSFFIYDVSKAPLRVHAHVVRDAAYWSIAFVDSDTAVFLLVRDVEAKDDDFTVVLTASGQPYTLRPGERVVTAPTSRGVVLIRMIVPDRYDTTTVARMSVEKAKSYIEPSGHGQ